MNMSFGLKEADHEGILIGFIIKFRLAEEHGLCTMFDNCTEMNTTICEGGNITYCEIYDLELNRNYAMIIAAMTSVGVGPFSDYYYGETDIYSECRFYEII